MAESFAILSSAPLGTDQARFEKCAIFNPGTGFDLRRAVLAHNFEPGICLGWSSRVAARWCAENPDSPCTVRKAGESPSDSASDCRPDRRPNASGQACSLAVHPTQKAFTAHPGLAIHHPVRRVDQVARILRHWHESLAFGSVGDWTLAHGSSFC